MPLKVVAAAAGILAAIVAGVWLLIGGGGEATHAATPAPAAAAAKPPAPPPKEAEVPPAPEQVPKPDSGQLPAPLAAAATAAEQTGSVKIVAPFPLEVREGGARLGDSSSPIALAAGRHSLDLSSEAVGSLGAHVVEVQPGRSVSVAAKLPQGRAHINATPWADVFIDGKPAGQTPLGNVSLAVGSHEIVFRHPQLGEQVRTLVVPVGSPARLSVEMKQ